jgi:hypothetical protein
VVVEVGTVFQAKRVVGVICIITMAAMVHSVTISRASIFDLSSFELSKYIIFKLLI